MNAEMSVKMIMKNASLTAICDNDKKHTYNQLDPEDEDSWGWTCDGITPEMGWRYRRHYPNCNKCKKKSDKPNFVKCCHDINPADFKRNTLNMFINQYFDKAGCNWLRWPAYDVCAGMAVEDVSRAQLFRQRLGKCGKTENDGVIYCKKFLAMAKKYYKDQAASDPDLQGTLRDNLRKIREQKRICERGDPEKPDDTEPDNPPTADALKDLAPMMPYPAGMPLVKPDPVKPTKNIRSRSPPVTAADDGDSPAGPEDDPPEFAAAKSNTAIGSTDPKCAKESGNCIVPGGACQGRVLPNLCTSSTMVCCVTHDGMQLYLDKPLLKKKH